MQLILKDISCCEVFVKFAIAFSIDLTFGKLIHIILTSLVNYCFDFDLPVAMVVLLCCVYTHTHTHIFMRPV